ncbi:hypothetical protein D6858_14690 [Tsuneonella suprasediminis]|uniref:Capsule polysaccharide biosynthesis protein n=1 Tax=Tsuneonella suprasediminis TaxID=2306996 RepID=A0A419QY12_9SPHN|nr:hypothetical protein [Tsuneonella suprasediminis]RJX65553.1 hypothetical protein D6858_14690 [Tsuneonella suprasediminis]
MNILLLSNSAPNYFNFFNALARLLHNDGHSVHIAVDSTFSREENQLDTLEFATVHTFSEYYTSNAIDHDTLRRYSHYNLNGALLSDFERSQIYNIWGEEADTPFFDRLKSTLLGFFEQIIADHQIDTVIYENVSNTFAHFALFMAQQNGAQYVGLSPSRLPGRFAITADPWNDKVVERAFGDIQTGSVVPTAEVRNWVREYLAGIEKTVPDYMKINGLDNVGILKRYLRRDRLKKAKSLFRHLGDDRTSAFQVGNPLRTHFNLFARNLKRRLRTGKVRNFYSSPDYEADFFLYPLHFHPESSTSILAGTYLNEYEVIRNIAFNLPEGMRLYVKDHMSAWAFPPVSFYRDLQRLPNVVILGPGEPTKELIKASRGVLTLTSTVGYEALLLKKRVLLYGDVFYSFHKGVTRCDNPTQLHHLLCTELAQPIDWDDQYNEDFVCAYYYSTFDQSLNFLLPCEPAQKLSAAIYPYILKSM